MSVNVQCRLRWLPALALLTLSAACGDDAKETPVDAGSDSSAQPTLPVEAGAPSVDAGAATPDEGDGNEPGDAAPEPTLDGAVEGDDTDGAAPVDGDGGSQVSTPLPATGDRLSVCYAKADCNGDDLVCYLPDGARPGYCTDNCAADTDCQPLGGVATSCSPDGFCRMDCAGTGAGDGACPADMVCRAISLTTNPLGPSYRCTYPDGSGKRSVPSYERCDRGHGDADCSAVADGCYAPALNLGGIFGPGYCAPACTEAASCGTVPAGTTATPVCGLTGRCELDCGAAGKGNCPTGMNCVNINPSALTPPIQRCRFID